MRKIPPDKSSFYNRHNISMSHHRPSEFVTAHLLLAREIIGGDIEPETTLKIDCENASLVIK